VSRTWAEFLGRENGESQPDEGSGGWFSRLRDSLATSRQALTREISTAVFDPGDDEAWERIEEALLAADCGVPATVEIVRRLEAREPVTEEELLAALEEVIAELVAPAGEARLHLDGAPTVILVVGVNGTGKTTTIGKLASRLAEAGLEVVLAAADTFRAAAEEQLEIWSKRAQADFVGSERGGDPAAVAYDAIEAAQARGRDVVIVDTA
jgi:fused signal recognition particle receptor